MRIKKEKSGLSHLCIVRKVLRYVQSKMENPGLRKVRIVRRSVPIFVRADQEGKIWSQKSSYCEKNGARFVQINKEKSGLGKFIF